MITHPAVWRRAEARIEARRRLSYPQARRAFAQLHRYARLLNRLPPADPLEGLETDLQLAKALQRLPCD